MPAISAPAVPGTRAAPAPAAEELDAGAIAQTLEQAVAGFGLPAAAERELHLASSDYADESGTEAHLLNACDLAPMQPAALIGLYRFYFYRNRLGDALGVGKRCLELAALLNGLPADWRAVLPQHADFGGFSFVPRFYLFSLKACAYLQLRLGNIEAGAAMVEQLMTLDPTDKVNGSVLRGVLERHGRDDDE